MSACRVYREFLNENEIYSYRRWVDNINEDLEPRQIDIVEAEGHAKERKSIRNISYLVISRITGRELRDDDDHRANTIEQTVVADTDIYEKSVIAYNLKLPAV